MVRVKESQLGPIGLVDKTDNHSCVCVVLMDLVRLLQSIRNRLFQSGLVFPAFALQLHRFEPSEV